MPRNIERASSMVVWGTFAGDVTGTQTATVVKQSMPSGCMIILPFDGSQSAGTLGSVFTANQTIVYKFFLPRTITVNSITTEILTLLAASKVGCGVYSLDGNTRLIDSGPLDSSTTGAKTTAVSAVVLAGNAYYWAAFNVTSATTLQFAETFIRPGVVNGGSATFLGVAANASSAGQLPATLGVITPTASTASSCPFMVFKLQN